MTTPRANSRYTYYMRWTRYLRRSAEQRRPLAADGTHVSLTMRAAEYRRHRTTLRVLRNLGCSRARPYRSPDSRRGRLRGKPRCRADYFERGLLHRLIGQLNTIRSWPHYRCLRVDCLAG